MYQRILITNRSDCAFRLIRACHAENIQAFVIAARDDHNEVLEKLADNIIYTGMSREAYTSQEDILEAAHHFGCEAILPGWGFLSEDFSFARRTRLMGIDFIGPTSKQIQIFGDKFKTIQFFSDALDTPPQAFECRHPDAFERITQSISAPFMLKNRFGGGGKNISRTESADELQKRFESLSKQNLLNEYFVEPAIVNGRHIEIQYFGDGNGSVELLGSRDCTAQVSHQKWLEYSFDLSRAPMLQSQAQRAASKLSEIHYQGWGTLEFIIDASGNAHLLELNPRLQVEHGVTEMTSGIDLVRTAIRLSHSGKYLPCALFGSASPLPDAIEFRLFARSTGKIESIGFEGYAWPDHPFSDDPHFRIESSYRKGDEITGVYDGLIARFILNAPANEAHDILKKWLSSFRLEGILHNLNDLFTYLPPNTNVR